MSAHELFAKYLDLTPLRGKTRGLVRCIFHAPDCTPSLSVNLELAVFYCFGCGARGGVRKFAALVGETLDAKPRTPSRRPRTPLEEARQEILRTADRQLARHTAYRELNAEADSIRVCHEIVARARGIATAPGPSALDDDHPVCELLAQAARLEVATLAAEARLDDELAAVLPTMRAAGDLPIRGGKPTNGTISVEVL